MVFQIWCILLGLGVAARPGQVNVLHYVTGEARALVSLQKGASFLQERQVSDAVGKALTISTMKVGQRFRVETDVAGWELATLRRIHPTYLLEFDDGETMEVDQPTKVPVRPERRHLSASLVQSTRTVDPPSPPDGSTPTAEELIDKEIQAQKNLEDDLPKEDSNSVPTQEKDEEDALPKDPSAPSPPTIDEHGTGATDTDGATISEFPADLPDPEATDTEDGKELSSPTVTGGTSMDDKSPVSNEATDTEDGKELSSPTVSTVTSMDDKSPVSNEEETMSPKTPVVSPTTVSEGNDGNEETESSEMQPVNHGEEEMSPKTQEEMSPETQVVSPKTVSEGNDGNEETESSEMQPVNHGEEEMSPKTQVVSPKTVSEGNDGNEAGRK
eukprot:symbB.v1.2.017156.t1/scaffold1331.1/size125086/10